MKLETFFEKFDQFADTSDAVGKMRALVLNLAIQGRLVSNSTENPLSAEQIAVEKQRRLRELNLRSHPETPLPTEDDFPFRLPKSWHAVSLGDLAFSCPTSYGEDPISSLPKAGVVKVGNIDNRGGFKGQFSERGFPANEIESLLARRGDLMVVKSSGSAENVHSGKTALCTAEHDGKIVGSNFVLRLRLFGTSALPEYVWRVLTSRYSREWVEGTVQTMTYPNLKWPDFARLPIPLPPLAVQKRIVTKVDELMALCDRLEAQQQERETRHAALARASLARFAEAPTPASLQLLFHESYAIPPADLRKSILTLAVRGRLTKQDPSERVDAISETHTNGLPSNWKQMRFRNLVTLQHGHQFRNYDFVKSGIPVIKIGQCKKDGTLDLSDCDYIAVERSEEFKDFRITKDDILMALTGGTLGKVTVVNKDYGIVVQNYRVGKFIPKLQFYSNGFTEIVLRSELFQSLVSDAVNQNAQPNIGKEKIEELLLPVPPLAEQPRIVAKVGQLMTLVDQLETQLAASRAIGANLVDAIVSELSAAA